jgi:hypothetical protein
MMTWRPDSLAADAYRRLARELDASPQTRDRRRDDCCLRQYGSAHGLAVERMIEQYFGGDPCDTVIMSFKGSYVTWYSWSQWHS